MKLKKDVTIPKGTVFNVDGANVEGTIPVGKNLKLTMSVPNSPDDNAFKRWFGTAKSQQ